MGSIKGSLVYKSNELIEGRYKLSSVAQKISVGIISCVDPSSVDPLPIFRLSLQELSGLSGVHREVLRKTLGKYTRELKSVVIEIMESGSLSYRQLGLFREFSYDDRERVLNITFEEKLEAYIRDFSGNFTKYRVEQIRSLVSGHAVRLYEILIMTYNKHKAHSDEPVYESSLEDLKAMLGIEKSAYKGRYNNFKTRVLDVARKELSEKTDLRFRCSEKKIGRKVVSLQFYVSPNDPEINLDEAVEGSVVPDKLDIGLLEMIYGIMPEVDENAAQSIVLGYEKLFLTEALLDVARAKMNGVDIKNDLSYLRGVLKKKRQEDGAISKDKAGISSDREWANEVI